MLHVVVMAGGSGTRFWPQSRQAMPKQLLRLAGDQTMIQQTVGRCDGWIPPANIWVVTNQMQAEETGRQIPEVPKSNILIEPCGRNTAPCIGLAAIQILQQDPDGLMFVMPADHVIGPQDVFQQAGRTAEQLVVQDPGRFVLFGVPPTFPSTGYGYIERNLPIEVVDGTAYSVASFREKPVRDVAQQYLDEGSYYWNCGIFCWQAEAILNALREYEPNIHARLMTLADAIGTEALDTTLAAEFPQMDSISIDYAVLERSDSVAVVEAPFAWDDVGSWLALPRLLGADDHNNTVDGDFCGVDSSGCIVRSSDGHLIATLGVKDLIIVHTPDATLVAKRDDADSIRKLVDALRDAGHDELL
jgi:mannose-1-phosphate guanylyltransferase